MNKNRPAALAGLALVCSLVATAPAGGGTLKILAPPDGVRFDRTPATLIGSGSSGELEITLNGKKVDGIKQSGRAFTAPLGLVAGENVVLVRSGIESLQRTVSYDTREGGTQPYRYHEPVAEGECKECHPQGVGRTTPVSEAKLCGACHDPQTGYKFLHGPLGAGQCVICHDPHGSASGSLLTASTRALCVLCHAQSRSQAHIERSASKQCPECHNPHGSGKQYFLY